MKTTFTLIIDLADPKKGGENVALKIGKTAKKSGEASAGALVLAAVVAVMSKLNPDFNGFSIAISAVIIGVLNFTLKWLADWLRHRG